MIMLFYRWTAYLLVLLLPLLVVLPQLGTSFFGTDFQFPYMVINDLGSLFQIWSDNYIGEDNIAGFKFFPFVIAKLAYIIVGYRYAPHFFVYITLFLYLASMLHMTGMVIKYFALDTISKFDICLIKVLILLLAFSSPVVFGYITTYFTIGILLATFPIILSLGYLFAFIKNDKEGSMVAAILLTIFISHPPTFLFYIGIVVLLLMISGKGLYNSIYFSAGAMLLAAFWLLPMTVTLLSPGTVSMSADTGYVGHMFNLYSNSINILTNVIFSIYPNTKLFDVVPIYLYGVLFAGLYALILYVLFTKSEQKIKIIISQLIIVFTVILTFSFGAKYALGGIFMFVWEHVTLLHFFKSFTQILNIGIIIYIAIIVFSLLIFLKKSTLIKRTFVVMLIIINLILIVVAMPRMARHIHRGSIPNEYREAQNIINQDIDEDFRILTLPEIQYEFYNWNAGWDQHFLAKTWFNRSVVSFNDVIPIVGREMKPKNDDYTKLFLDINAKYLLVHHDYMHDKYKPKSFVFDYSIVEPVMSSEFFTLYKLKEEYVKSRIYSEQNEVHKTIEYTKKKNTLYNISVKNLNTRLNMMMRETYSADWKLAIVEYSDGCVSANKKVLFFNDTHRRYEGYMNSWELSKNVVYKDLSKKFFKENEDGSIDMCLILHHGKQKYISLAILITLGTLLILLYRKYHE